MQDVIGFRGEKIVELRLTEEGDLDGPLFWPSFLGEKWPAIDFYVELLGIDNRRPYCLIQVKSTRSRLDPRATHLKVSTKKQDIQRLLQIPGPTYVFGVHEPTRRVFVRSVHVGIQVRGISRIPLAHELTSENLRRLYNEVNEFWHRTEHKPVTSVF